MRRRHDRMIALVLTLFFVILSLPFRFSFDSVGEAPVLWVAYFGLGAGLAVYVLYVFLQSTRRLIRHELKGEPQQRGGDEHGHE